MSHQTREVIGSLLLVLAILAGIWLAGSSTRAWVDAHPGAPNPTCTTAWEYYTPPDC